MENSVAHQAAPVGDDYSGSLSSAIDRLRTPEKICIETSLAALGRQGEGFLSQELGMEVTEVIEMELKGEEGAAASSKTLPEDLVERIVAVVPFPSVFKARALSKSWLARFSPVKRWSSEGDDKKAEKAAFQKQVSEWSKNNWQTFCPIFMCKENFMAYERTSQNWRRLPSLSHLPENLVLARSNLQIEGPLLYGFGRPETRTRRKELYVANILTRSWKQLPPRPNQNNSVVLCSKLVVSLPQEEDSKSSYKVILVCREQRHDQFDRYSAQIYDSKSDSWNSKKLLISSDFFRLTTAAYHDGILYMVADANPRDLLAFNVNEGTFEELKMPFVDTMRVISANLVVCNGSLLMVVTEGFHQQNQQVLKIDLKSRRLLEVARGPPAHLDIGAISTQPVSDGNCIYFGVEEGSTSRVLAYSVHDEEWSSFPFPQPVSHHATSNADRKYKWSASSFQPGLSPFVAV